VSNVFNKDRPSVLSSDFRSVAQVGEAGVTQCNV
jgi:hypothetical protein